MKKELKLKSNVCDLEREKGIQANRFMGGCRGYIERYIITYCDGEIRDECILNNQCTKCKKHIYWKYAAKTRDIIVLIILLFSLYILGTPEGMIRYNIWISRGLGAACTSNIEEIPETRAGSSKGTDYKIEIEDHKEVWKVIEVGHAYIVSEKYND